jgi:hypothetical protein
LTVTVLRSGSLYWELVGLRVAASLLVHDEHRSEVGTEAVMQSWTPLRPAILKPDPTFWPTRFPFRKMTACWHHGVVPERRDAEVPATKAVAMLIVANVTEVPFEHVALDMFTCAEPVVIGSSP